MDLWLWPGDQKAGVDVTIDTNSKHLYLRQGEWLRYYGRGCLKLFVVVKDFLMSLRLQTLSRTSDTTLLHS